MPNNPVQILLNTQNYIQRSENNGGGNSKDFYAGRDESFRRHKEKLIHDVNLIQEKLSTSETQVSYAHVILSSEAWAKSHRPVNQVFPENKVHQAGGGAIGEMLVELTQENIGGVTTSIAKAEEETTWKINNNGKRVAKPSRVRSEVGGISEIRMHSPTDRRNFSAEQAVEWFADPRTGGMYMIQTFATEREVQSREYTQQSDLVLSELNKFLAMLNSLDMPISINTTSDQWESVQLLLVKLNLDYTNISKEEAIEMHQSLLTILDNESLVRRVMLPPIIEKAHAVVGRSDNTSIDIPQPRDDIDYPVVGVIDTGIEERSVLEPWIVGSSSVLDGYLQDKSHGTFIGGLTAIGNELNDCDYLQESPCKIFDLGMFVIDPLEFNDYYPNGFLDFLEQLEVELITAKDKGVRIFNMSLSIEQHVQDDAYSIFAAYIDEISDRQDIVFVLPAGNLNGAIARNVWPINPTDAVQMLADYRHQGMDRIFQPADSIRSVVVGALNPPTDEGQLIPAEYTRRGPGTALGAKPDVAHIGGRFHQNSGLFSIDTAGSIVEGCGTSYAAPLAAKTLATIEHSIKGGVSRETLIGLLIHNAEQPATLKHSSLNQITKDFVGHGIPKHGLDLLHTDDHAITLVFTGHIIGRHELIFPFSWPASLVSDEGKCRGRAKMTLTYTPFTNPQYDAEYIRVNLDAYLRQEKVNTDTGEISYKGFFTPDSSSTYEKERIEHGQKWWPIKRKDKTSPRGVGTSSQWRLVVDALTRAGDVIPEEGISFSVILTIEDPNQESPVFNELRRTLQSSGATISDIRTAQRVLPRT